jgi:hypothetical protein
MITLTFSRAILIFFAIQTLLYLLLLIASERKTNVNTGINTKVNISARVLSAMMILLYIILIAGNLLVILGKINYTFQTIIVVTVPLVLMTLSVACPKAKLMFVLTILWHMLLISSARTLNLPLTTQGFSLGFAMTTDLISIYEGSHMTRTMIMYGRWIPELAHNPSYNPFPTIAFLHATLSNITGIPWFSWFVIYILLLITLLAFDLVIYDLTLTITSSHTAAIFAVIVGALTPYLVVTGQAYQISASIMGFLSITIFIKTLTEPRRANLISIMLLYVTAILTHASAYIVMTFPLILTLLRLLLERRETSFKVHPIVKNIIILFLVLGIFRIAYEELYAKYVYNLGYSGITSLMNRLLALFTEEESIRLKLSLYDYSGIPFYQAFLWVLTASLATATIIHSILKKRINAITLAFFISGALFIGLGYLLATLTAVSTQLYRGAYVAFSFFIPLATEATERIVNSRKKSLALIVVFILAFSSFLATRDPEISPLYKLKSRGIPEEALTMAVTQSDIVKANITTNLVNEIKVFNDLMLFSKYSLRFERFSTYGRHITMIYSRFSDALYKALYIRGYTIGDAPIVNINVVDPSKHSISIASYSIVINFGDEIVFEM